MYVSVVLLLGVLDFGTQVLRIRHPVTVSISIHISLAPATQTDLSERTRAVAETLQGKTPTAVHIAAFPSSAVGIAEARTVGAHADIALHAAAFLANEAHLAV